MSIFNKKPLTRDDILGVQDIEIEEVEVPEWGGSVFVKGMTGIERDRFEASIVEQRGKNAKVSMVNIRAKLASETMCDKDGTKLFSVKDAAALGEKSAAGLDRVFDVSMRLSGISDDEIEELAEEMEANPSEGSATD